MTKIEQTNGAVITDLMLETFRLNGALLEAGDQLVKDLGLTSARWQVLGAIMLEGSPQTVAQIARRMGLSRQAVQRVVHDLTAQGLVEPSGNPDHKRAPLITLTPEGEAAYGDAIKRQDDWASELAGKIDGEQARAALDTLKALSALCGATRRHALPQKAKGGAQ